MQPPVLTEVILKELCEDFRVEELPAYEPCGEGEHLFLWVQKRDVSARHLIQVLSRQLKVSQRDIGVAGQKDRRAVTRQYVSVPAICEPRVASFQDEQIQILRIKKHGNKLRTGHVEGNRFEIVLRPTTVALTAASGESVSRRLMQISETGFPNYYGSQRFDSDGLTVRKGAQLLQGTSAEKRALRVSRFERKMLLSAVQSAVFNLVTAERVREGSVGRPVDGDVVCRRNGIRPFLYSDRNSEAVEQLIPMGPMPGRKMLPSEGRVLMREEAALQRLGLCAADFASSKDTPGVRRPMLAWPTDCSCQLIDNGAIKLCFDLPSGCYATVLLREIAQTIYQNSPRPKA